ncbi:ABC transporter substrate-binding protein [Halobacillus karajensis]|uniref:Leu/Ile/Val-binding protein n=1 Tax=Halobacillus karajensis TaxID=195088 RepID=A0A024P2Z7_9BACI|nr:ABC transporter substrate-binding protein [Halobacillus karajensis]CDQ19043.1 Leu/Ile/Val-binding protein precursor [Halobacillus karajensis]CDQ22883.1 Leu/Ile/Val-binding protein precursor [Halobacillus karajensis]CDQ26365.1 Leu/Ile/Val-binding protein precursor [Halobacillus karajensis]
MNVIKLSVFLLVSTLLLMMAGCIDNPSNEAASESGNESETGTEAPEVEEGEEVVNIGYSGPLSGPAAYYGERTLNGLTMAVEEINDNGGFEVDGQTYKFNVVALDDKYLPNETAANAKRLLQENQTPIIFSPHSGGIKAMQVFNEKENFLIGAYTSEPAATEAGNELTVRIPPSYDGYLEPFTKYAMENHGEKLAALPTASQYGKDWTEALVPYWKEQGGEVVYNSSIDFSKDTDFFTLVTNALKEEPDVLFIGGPSEPTAKVAKQARELGFEGGFIVMDQAKLDEMKSVTGSYEDLEGSVGVTPLINSDYPGTAEFVEKYKEEHGQNPGSEAGYHYVAMYTFMEAMKAAGSVDDPEAIRAHMQEGLDALPEDKQVYTIEEIGENGGFTTNLRIAAVEDGGVVTINVE